MSIGLDRAVLHGMMMTGGNIAGKGKSGMKVEARWSRMSVETRTGMTAIPGDRRRSIGGRTGGTWDKTGTARIVGKGWTMTGVETDTANPLLDRLEAAIVIIIITHLGDEVPHSLRMERSKPLKQRSSRRSQWKKGNDRKVPYQRSVRVVPRKGNDRLVPTSLQTPSHRRNASKITSRSSWNGTPRVMA